METITSCNTSSLAPFVPNGSNPWDEKKVNHVFRRLGYGASKTRINQALSQNPSDFIDSFIDDALAAPLFPEPSWASWTYSDYINAGLDFNEETQNNHAEVILDAIDDLFNTSFRGKMVLFWSNHFVTQLSEYYCSNFLYKYYNMLQRHALGNFQDFVREVGTNEAMLLYLNGFENGVYGLNENYSRELFELFTLGENNGYTQTDIVEAAKALSGYNHWNDYCGDIYFIPAGQQNSTFIDGPKTIFGQTGNWGYDDVIDILFAQRAPLIAEFVCTKLYKFFVSPVVNQDVVDQLAASFELDWNIANVLRTLLKSEHFFDDNAIGSQIKSPYELSIGFLNTADFPINLEQKTILYYYANVVGQRYFEPPNVAGWQGDQSWINSSTLSGRWQFIEHYVWYTWNNNREMLRTLAIDASNNSNDPYVVAKSIIERFVPKELHTITDYDNATDIFKYNIPQNYYDNGQWNLYWNEAPFQVVLLLIHLSKMPELQIN